MVDEFFNEIEVHTVQTLFVCELYAGTSKYTLGCSLYIVQTLLVCELYAGSSKYTFANDHTTV